MFDIAPSEFILVGAVALVVIGPKDLPRAMHLAGKWIGRARGMARHFRVGLDEIVRQAELDEMQKKWAAENARIMAEHPLPPPEEAHDAHYAAGEPKAVMTPLPKPAEDARASEEGLFLGEGRGPEQASTASDALDSGLHRRSGEGIEDTTVGERG